MNKALFFPAIKRRLVYSRHNAYRRYRKEIREDCQGRCVYCDIHENELQYNAFSEQEIMTLDHFRPQDTYGHLKNDPTNLVYSCKTCNELKGCAWPAWGTSSTIFNGRGFLDPFITDLHLYFNITDNGKFIPLMPPAEFIIKQLKLNREIIRRVREKRIKIYEVYHLSILYIKQALTQIDEILNKPLTLAENERLLVYRDKLWREYEELLEKPIPDFTLR